MLMYNDGLIAGAEQGPRKKVQIRKLQLIKKLKLKFNAFTKKFLKKPS